MNEIKNGFKYIECNIGDDVVDYAGEDLMLLPLLTRLRERTDVKVLSCSQGFHDDELGEYVLYLDFATLKRVDILGKYRKTKRKMDRFLPHVKYSLTIDHKEFIQPKHKFYYDVYSLEIEGIDEDEDRATAIRLISEVF